MTAVRTRPWSVTVAAGALLAQAAWAVANAVLVLANQDVLRDSIESAAREQGLSSYDISNTVEVGIFVNVVGGVVLSAGLVAGTLILVRLLLRASPVGRTATFVACGIMLVLTVINLCVGVASGESLPGRWLAFIVIGNLFYMAVYVTVIELLRRRDAAAFFAQPRDAVGWRGGDTAT